MELILFPGTKGGEGSPPTLPSFLRRQSLPPISRGGIHPRPYCRHSRPRSGIHPSLPPNPKLEGRTCAKAQVRPSVFPSPLPSIELEAGAWAKLMRLPLFFSPPLPYRAYKGEGEKGGEGSPPTPLTYKHIRSIIGACLDSIPTLGRNQKPREARQTPPKALPPRNRGTQRLSPSQRPSRRPATHAGTSASSGERWHPLEVGDAISSPHGSRDPFPDPRRWKVHLLYAAHPLPGAPAESVFPFLGRLCRPH